MTDAIGRMDMSGTLTARIRRAGRDDWEPLHLGPEEKAPTLARLRNRIRRLRYDAQTALARALGIMTMTGELRARKWDSRRGVWVDYGIVSRRVVTDAGVAFLVDDWVAATQDITNMNFHDSGTGILAEAVGDTDLGTPAGPTTRATGTKSEPAANQARSVGTISYTAALAITEHGLFNQAARGAGSVLWDRSVFAAVNVVNGDAIEFTYTCTVNSGG